MTNDTPNNILCSFAIFGGGTCKQMKAVSQASKSGEINLMLDSGAYSAFMTKGYDHVTMDNYCRWLDRFADSAEKYVMLDVIGYEGKTKKNYETMRKSGYNPMYVYTLTAKDNAFCLDAIKASNDVCVAGGQMKCDWLIQRYQRVLKMSGGKARIHGLAFVTFPKMLQCGLASVDSSSFAMAPIKYASIPWFKDGIHKLDRRRFVAGLKKRDAVCRKIADDLRLTVKDVATEENYHQTASIPFYIGVRAYMQMQRYCYRRGLRLFFAISQLTQLRAVQYFSRNWLRPDYNEFKKFLTLK